MLKSLELCRIVTDLIWCYTIVFGHVDVDIGDSVNIRSVSHRDVITNYTKVIASVLVVRSSS